MTQDLRIHMLEEHDHLFYNQDALVKLTAQYPHLWGGRLSPAIGTINHYYEQKSWEFWRHIRETVFREALELYLDLMEIGQPMRAYEVNLKASPQLLERCQMSISFDEYSYMGGAHGITFRSSDSWNLESGYRYHLEDFFPPNSDYRRLVQQEIIRQIREQMSADEAFYFDETEQLVGRNFNDENFYLTPEGITIYFQQYDIAPYAAGIPEFVIPFGTAQAAMPPC